MVLARAIAALAALCAADAFKLLGGGGSGYATTFAGFGLPYGGCGVPQTWMRDDAGGALPFVALNTFGDVDGKTPGLFASGANCGRWLRMTACRDCKGGSSDQWRTCVKGGSYGPQNYSPDALSGALELYGYVADSCGDYNVWCRESRYHLDVSRSYLSKYVDGGLWNNRIVKWQFIDGPPPAFKQAAQVRFGWAEGAYLPYYPALIAYGTRNGVSAVVAKAAGGWVAARRNGALGQMWILPANATLAGRAVTVRVWDVAGREYGTFSVRFPCRGACTEPTRAE